MNKIRVMAALSFFAVLPATIPGGNRGKQKTNSEIHNVVNYKSKIKSIYEKPTVKIYPDTLVQGQTAIIDIQARQNLNLKKAYFMFASESDTAFKKTPIYKFDERNYVGLIGMSPRFKPGNYKIIVGSEDKRIADTIDIVIKQGVYVPQRPKFTDSIGGLKASAYELNKIRKALSTVSDKSYFYDLPPYELPTKGLMSTEYGAMRPSFHSGIDIAAPMGQEVKAILSGKVLVAEMFDLHGGTVIIDHGAFKSMYLHMSPDFKVKQGDIVKKGQVINTVNSTGHSNGPHLHFGIYPNGISSDPEAWLKSIVKKPDLIERMRNLPPIASGDSIKKVRALFEAMYNGFIPTVISPYIAQKPITKQAKNPVEVAIKQLFKLPTADTSKNVLKKASRVIR